MSLPLPVDPYLEFTDFETQFGHDLTAAETPVAKRLIQVVSDWVRDHAPADVSEFAAQQVVFEVVRDALTYGGMELLSQFQNTTAHRTEAGTFDASMKAVDDYLTDRHKLLLGIPLRAAPRGSFKKCDY